MHTVIGFVVLCNAVQHLNGFVYGRLIDRYRLETAFQCRILFDIFAVFFKGGGTNNLYFPTGECRLQDICCIHGTLRISGTYQIVHLIDKQNDVAFLLHLCQQALDTAFKLSAELGTGNQRSQIQQVYLLIFQMHGNVSGVDPQSNSLGNCRFADTGFTDQTGIVLGAAGENLNHPCNFLIPSNDCVQLALCGTAGQVRAVIAQEPQFLFPLGTTFPSGTAWDFCVVC